MKVCVIGSGKWGTAIYNLIKKNGFNATLLSRLEYKTLQHSNFDLLFIALKTEVIEEFIANSKGFLPSNVCSLSKGIYSVKEPFLSNIIENFAVLSGPNFADEVEAGCSTISTVASKNITLIESIKTIIQNKNFKIDTTTKIEAVQCYGIFKNIIAIYMGILEASKCSYNTRSMIFTALISEMQNFILHFDKIRESFFLSCGIGDIFLTATSSKSRNFSFGMDFYLKKNTNEGTVEGLRSLQAIPIFEEKYGFKFNFYKKLFNQIILKQQNDLFNF